MPSRLRMAMAPRECHFSWERLWLNELGYVTAVPWLGVLTSAKGQKLPDGRTCVADRNEMCHDMFPCRAHDQRFGWRRKPGLGQRRWEGHWFRPWLDTSLLKLFITPKCPHSGNYFFPGRQPSTMVVRWQHFPCWMRHMGHFLFDMFGQDRCRRKNRLALFTYESARTTEELLTISGVSRRYFAPKREAIRSRTCQILDNVTVEGYNDTPDSKYDYQSKYQRTWRKRC